MRVSWVTGVVLPLVAQWLPVETLGGGWLRSVQVDWAAGTAFPSIDQRPAFQRHGVACTCRSRAGEIAPVQLEASTIDQYIRHGRSRASWRFSHAPLIDASCLLFDEREGTVWMLADMLGAVPLWFALIEGMEQAGGIWEGAGMAVTFDLVSAQRLSRSSPSLLFTPLGPGAHISIDATGAIHCLGHWALQLPSAYNAYNHTAAADAATTGTTAATTAATTPAFHSLPATTQRLWLALTEAVRSLANVTSNSSNNMHGSSNSSSSSETSQSPVGLIPHSHNSAPQALLRCALADAGLHAALHPTPLLAAYSATDSPSSFDWHTVPSVPPRLRAVWEAVAEAAAGSGLGPGAGGEGEMLAVARQQLELCLAARAASLPVLLASTGGEMYALISAPISRTVGSSGSGGGVVSVAAHVHASHYYLDLFCSLLDVPVVFVYALLPGGGGSSVGDTSTNVGSSSSSTVLGSDSGQSSGVDAEQSAQTLPAAATIALSRHPHSLLERALGLLQQQGRCGTCPDGGDAEECRGVPIFRVP